MKQKLLQMYFWIFAVLAKIYVYRHKPTVIGVTGSIGKTSCRMLISEILTQSFPEKTIYTSSKNFNGELGMSLSLLGISDYTPTPKGVLLTIAKSLFIALFARKKYDVIFLEYGIDHIGEMAFMLNVVKPELAVVTKIDKVHSSQFQNTDVTAKEKYQLLQSTLSQAYLNIDDSYAFMYAQSIGVKHRYFATTLDSQSQDIDVRGEKFVLFQENSGVFSSLDILLDGEKKATLRTNSLGEENIGYMAIGYDMVDYLSKKWYKKSFFESGKNSQLNLDFTLQPSRFSILEGVKNSILLDSTYNAAPESMKVVIQNAHNIHQKIFGDYSILFVLGEMRELGEYSEEEHKNLANFVSNFSQEVWGVGSEMKYFKEEFEKKGGVYYGFPNSKILGEHLKTFLLSQDKKYFIVFKGSQNTIFLEEAVKGCLAYESDVQKLCRQEKYWGANKNAFFASTSQ